jgi:hypothetical protein
MQRSQTAQWIVVLLMLISLARGSRAAEVTAKERHAVFAWFDSLGYPSLSHKPFIEITINNENDGKAVPEYRQTGYGFLLGECGSSFSALMVDLVQKRFVKSQRQDDWKWHTTYRPLDLKSWCSNWVQQARSHRDATGDIQTIFTGAGMDRIGETFVLARACEAAGYRRQADILLSYSADLAAHVQVGSSPSYLGILEEVVADSAFSYIIRQEEDPSVSAASILALVQNFARRFPSTSSAPEALSLQTIFTQIVDQMRMHAASVHKPLAQMQGEERIKELIFQLRDQCGRTMMNPGGCDIFADLRGPESPAGQLVKLGYSAVPDLIAHLDDSSYTRSFETRYRLSQEPAPLRVGDVACAILQKIASRRFDYHGTSAYIGMAKMVAESRPLVTAWWASISRKGERRTLIEAVEEGDDNSRGAADLLVQRYPADALGAIRVGLSHATDPDERINLIWALNPVKDAAVTPLLQQQMRTATEPEVRYRAMQSLIDRDNEEALTLAIKDWEQPPANATETYLRNILIETFTSCRDIRGLKELAGSFSRLPVDQRADIVNALHRTDATPAAHEDSPPAVMAAKATYDRLVERMLAQALLDTEVREGMSIGDLHDPRICELAAVQLAELWPSRYHFANSSSRLVLDTQRMKLYNVWRSANGAATSGTHPGK